MGGNRKTPPWAWLMFSRLTLASLALLALYLALGSVPAVQAEGRKAVKVEQPEYPAVLKRMGIGGTVVLHVTVLANGSVANVEVASGNQILAESATKAVMKWKFPSGPETTQETIALEFKAH